MTLLLYSTVSFSDHQKTGKEAQRRGVGESRSHARINFLCASAPLATLR